MPGINKRAKGYRVEKAFRDMLKADGWITDIKNRSRFSTNDFFGLFDVVAVKGDCVKFVQVKSNASHVGTARKNIALWIKEKKLLVNCEIALYLGRGKWKIEEIKPPLAR